LRVQLCYAAPPSDYIPLGGAVRYGWLEVECHRCETRASIPLDAIRRPRDAPIWKLEAAPNGLPAEACSELSRLFRRPVSPYS
jgi:hypothetical protein